MSLGNQDCRNQHQHRSQGHQNDSNSRESQSQPRQNVQDSNPVPRHNDQQGSAAPQRPAYDPYAANVGDINNNNNNSWDWKYIAGGVLAMVIAIPVCVSGVLYLRGILKSEYVCKKTRFNKPKPKVKFTIWLLKIIISLSRG